MKLPKGEQLLLLVSCVWLCNPMDCSPPVSSVHGIFPARILEWVVISFSRGSSWTRDQTQVSCIAVRFFTIWATRDLLTIGSGWKASRKCCKDIGKSNSEEFRGGTPMTLLSHLIFPSPFYVTNIYSIKFAIAEEEETFLYSSSGWSNN